MKITQLGEQQTFGTSVKRIFGEIINHIVVCDPTVNAVLQHFHTVFNYYLLNAQK